MKVLYVESILTGHHLVYLSNLSNSIGIKNAVIIPEYQESIKANQFIYSEFSSQSNFLEYFKWIRFIKNIAIKEEIDIIHFVYADIFYKYLFLGLKSLRKYKLILTFHQFRRDGIKGKIKDYILKYNSRFINKIILHTKTLKKDLEELNIKNICQVEYPNFNTIECKNGIVSRKKIGIETNKMIIGFVGILSEYKGIDILIEAINMLGDSIYLLIAGKPNYFTEEYIRSNLKINKNNYKIIAKFLDDEEMIDCINCCDVLVLPYKKSFNGASGPLGIAVDLKKTIVASNHGSLGDIVSNNNLGYTFKCENSMSLYEVLKSIRFKDSFSENLKYKQYRESIKLDKFISKHKKIYRTLGD